MNQSTTWRAASKKRFVGIAIICASVAFSATAQESDQPVISVHDRETGQTISAEVTLQGGNIPKARQTALRTVMTEAAVLEAEKSVPKDVYLRNNDVLRELIYEDPKPLIRVYRPVRERNLKKKYLYEAKLEVDSEKLRDRLVRWGMIFDRRERPSFGIFRIEYNDPSKSFPSFRNTDWTNLIRQRVSDLGFRSTVINAQPSEQASVSDALGQYDIAVWGSVVSQGSNRVLFDLKSALRKPYSRLANTRKSVTVEKDEKASLMAGLAAVAMVSDVLPAWFRQVGEGKKYTVRVEGLQTVAPLQGLLTLFNSGKFGFSGGHESRLAPGQIDVDVVYDGELKGLIREIQKQISQEGSGATVQDSGPQVVSVIFK